MPVLPLRPLVLALLFILSVFAGCARSPARPAVSGVHAAESVTLSAIGLVGTPYRFGGNTPEGGFDCSGLIGHVFRDGAGLGLPRTVRALADGPWPRIDARQLRSGDLVFFAPGGGRPSHAGIYVGEGRFVHAPASGGTVRLDRLDSGYWQGWLRFGRRLLP
jgi:cell wall-associated NlpC family hydrolase